MMSHSSKMTSLRLALATLVVSACGALAADPTNAASVASTNALVAKETSATKSTNDAPATAAVAAKPAVPAAALNYEAFTMVADRNIFNQNRVPRSSRGTATNVVRRTPKIESLTLVGTMDYEKGKMAFFDGSSSQFKKAVKVGDSVGAFKLLDVTPSQVKLAGDKAEMELKLGQALRREDDGDWQLSSVSVFGSGASSTGALSGKPADSTPASDASASGGGADDALKRLLERRAKETNE
jgi:hypothetical protein